MLAAMDEARRAEVVDALWREDLSGKDRTMDREAYEATEEALHWVRVSFLQIDRYVGTFPAHAESKSAGGQVTADAAPTRTVADAHFLLNACAQAERALRRTGRALPRSH
jgi:hypothetical protein